MVETPNKHFVGIRAKNVVIMNPPRELSADDALVFAAWIVALARIHSTVAFEDVLEQVEST
jgi:hypothetical protein